MQHPRASSWTYMDSEQNNQNPNQTLNGVNRMTIGTRSYGASLLTRLTSVKVYGLAMIDKPPVAWA